MYRIGIFSKMNKITTKTLRHYDEIGLLKPTVVDEDTGYRYYSSEDLERLHRIITLKQLGFKLLEIKEIIDFPISIETFLKSKEQDIMRQIDDLNSKLQHIKSYKNRLSLEGYSEYNPVVREIPKVIAAYMKTKVDSYKDYFSVLPAMGKEMERQGAICSEPAYCFIIYYIDDYIDGDMEVEICEAVESLCEDSDLVQYREIAGEEKALCILHKGPYEFMGRTLDLGLRWIKDNDYDIVGSFRESYIDGIWNKENQEEWLTEIQIPIKEKA